MPGSRRIAAHALIALMVGGCGTLIAVDVQDGPSIDAGALPDSSVTADGGSTPPLGIPDATAEDVQDAVAPQPVPDAAADAGPCVPNPNACMGRCAATDNGCGAVVPCSATNCGPGQECAPNGSCTAVTCELPAVTCQATFPYCGATKTNNCGQNVPCTCTTGQSCFNGECCIPENPATTCAAVPCGTKVNNCGQTITCTNTCVAPNVCGAADAGANACGLCVPNPNPCRPMKQCRGMVDDGCGTLINCANQADACGPPVCPCGGVCGAFDVCGCAPANCQ